MPRRIPTDKIQIITGLGEPPRLLSDVSAADIFESGAARLIRSYRGQRHKPLTRWFATTGRHIECESHLEGRRLMLADFDPDVVDVKSQPFQAIGTMDGKTVRHVPDLLLKLRADRFHLVNVKNPRFIDDPRTVRTSAFAEVIAETKGWSYELWSGEDENRVRLRNIDAVFAFRDARRFDPSLLQHVRESGGSTRREIIDDLHQVDAVLVRAAVLHLLWTGDFQADFSSYLTDDAVIRRAGDAS